MRVFLLVLSVSLFASGCDQASGPGDSRKVAAPKATITLDEWSWLPTNSKHNAEVAKI
jgi:hypothetical protein